MKPITDLTNKFPSLYAAGKALNIHPQQLSRWIESGARLDDDGNVWIKTGKPINHKKAPLLRGKVRNPQERGLTLDYQ